MDRVALITNGNYFSRIILDNLFASSKHKVAGVVLVTGDYKANTGFKTLWLFLTSTAFPYVLYKLFLYATFKLARRLFPRRELEVINIVRHRRVPYLTATEVNTPQVTNFLKSLNPEILASVSCPQLIRECILELSTLGSINIHSSLLPAYADLAPYYWVLSYSAKAIWAKGRRRSIHYC